MPSTLVSPESEQRLWESDSICIALPCLWDSSQFDKSPPFPREKSWAEISKCSSRSLPEWLVSETQTDDSTITGSSLLRKSQRAKGQLRVGSLCTGPAKPCIVGTKTSTPRVRLLQFRILLVRDTTLLSLNCFPINLRTHASSPTVANVFLPTAVGAHMLGAHLQTSLQTATRRLPGVVGHGLGLSSWFNKQKWLADIRKWHKSDKGAISADISGPLHASTNTPDAHYRPLCPSHGPNNLTIETAYTSDPIAIYKPTLPCWTLGKCIQGDRKACLLSSVIGEGGRGTKCQAIFHIISFCSCFSRHPRGNLGWNLTLELLKPDSISCRWHIPQSPAPQQSNSGGAIASHINARWLLRAKIYPESDLRVCVLFLSCFPSHSPFSGTERKREKINIVKYNLASYYFFSLPHFLFHYFYLSF